MTRSRFLLPGVLAAALGVGGMSLYLAFVRSSPDEGSTPGAPAEEMCARHQIPERDCPWCDPSLIEKKGQCPGHGVPEALCAKCDPRLVAGFKAEGDWCAGHGVPESQCAICNPGVLGAPGDSEHDGIPLSSGELPQPSDVPRTQRAPSATCNKEALRVQFPSPETARNAGLEYARVERRVIARTLSCNAEIAYDGNRHARLSSRAPGVVREVRSDLGRRVEAGDVLAVVDSMDLGTAKAEFHQARALVSLWERNNTRELRLLERGVATERDLLEAETRLTESRISLSRATQKLQNLGLTDAQILELAGRKDASSLLPLTAPFAGTIVERSAAAGEVVDTSKPLFAIADTSRMWAILDVYASDVRKLRIGQAVALEVEGLRRERPRGRVTWVSSHVDRRTRTLKVRAEFANADGLLRAGMFGKAIVTVRKPEPVLLVPKEAVQWEGCCNVVFVRRSDVLFEPRKVRLGYETDTAFVVEDGVQEGETVVTTGSFLLKTEILKGSIGAGCCGYQPGKE
jgi:cobalt-zinc-cadmium efflux system membrane fusion protein